MKFKITYNFTLNPNTVWRDYPTVKFCSIKATEKHMAKEIYHGRIFGSMTLKQAMEQSIKEGFGVIFRVEPDEI